MKLAENLKLRPAKPIIVMQGQKVRLRCEAKGGSATKVEWKKQTNSGDVSVPDSTVTVVKDRSTNRIRVILNIKYARQEDSGVYKCVLTAVGKTNFKLTTITVKGILH